MHDTPLDILMVEDNAAQALLMRAAMKDTDIPHTLTHVTHLKQAIEKVSRTTDLILLDLGLPDSFGVETVRRMHQAAPEVPIVVLTGLNDEEAAVQAVREGAQDYLDKAQLNGRMLKRVIRYAIERSRSERQVRQAHDRFRLAAAAAHEIIYDWDLRENTVFRSDGIARVVGYPPEEAGDTMDWWFGLIHPDDLPVYQARLKEALSAGSTFLAEYRVRHRDGNYLHLWDRGLIVRNEDGEALRVVGGRLDITHRIRAEERLRETNEKLQAIIDACPLAIIALDREARVMTWNSAAEAMFGWREDEVLGRPLPTVPEDGRRQFDELLGHDLRGHPRRGLEARRMRRDGTLIDVSISTSPIHDRSGQIVAVMGILEDITLRKQAEKERAALQEQLHQAQKLEAVGQLAAGVAHDFNNLLTVILGNVDRMSRMISGDSECRNVLGMIAEAARQATGVTRSLLTFSHKIPTVKERVDLKAAVRESARLLERLLPRSIEVSVELPPDASVLVYGDRSQLQQILLNLAINARDAMPHGGLLAIRLSRPPALQADGSGQVRLEVEDTGTGIPEENLSQIFDPFFTTKQRGQGTGLGLAIVRSIVEDHGGRIDVESIVGRGSRFIVTLPAVGPGTEREAAPQAPDQIPRGEGQLVLLAEDNAYVREVIASALRSFGYRVMEAADGTSALAAHEKHRGEIAVIVFDNDMPGRTGLQCIREIRRRGDHSPAIITSGSVGDDFEEELEDQIILLRKPFQMSELARVLAGALQIRETSQ